MIFFQSLDEYFFTCIYTDTEGKHTESVGINGVSILGGLIVLFSILENVYLLLEQTIPF